MNPLRFLEQLQPVHLGHAEIREHQVEARLGQHGSGLRAVFRLAHVMAERFEKSHQAQANVFFVVNDQQSGHQDCAPTGSCTMKRLPWPLLLSTKIRPPCASTMSFDDCEPESGRAGRIAIGAVLGEAFEDVVANFRRDAGPAIRHFELREINPRRPGRDLDGAAFGRVAQRVADEVGNHP